MAWFCLVLPALLINYFGQGALVLANPATIENPFYRLVPEVLLLPMVVLATVATVIASQAVITGAYSITHQAIQLGLLPRLEIRHTSAALYGQIYMPRVNTLLLIGVLLLVGLFRTSSDLAGAYVLAVAATSLMATLLAFVVVWKDWQWQLWTTVLLMSPFIVVDTTYLVAALMKLGEGAWLPVLFGALVVLVMTTWRRGTAILAQKTRRVEVPLDTLVASLEKKPPHIAPGTAVFLTSDPEFAPTALLHNLKHNKVLHEHNVILTIVFADTPRVDGKRPRDHRAGVGPLPPRRAEIRLHGPAERAKVAGDRPQARLDLRHHVDVVLPVAPLDQGVGPFRACRAGRTACSSGSPVRRRMPPTSSISRPAGWWRWAPR